jgi:hypothetical protein
MTFTARRLLRCMATSSVAMACVVDVDALWNYADAARAFALRARP